jgi:hypothetical protein
MEKGYGDGKGAIEILNATEFFKHRKQSRNGKPC